MLQFLHRNLRINQLTIVYDAYVENLFNFNRALSKLEKFTRINYISLTTSFDKYGPEFQEKTRLFYIILSRLAIFLTMIKFYIPLFMKNNSNKIYLMDFGEILGHPLLASSTLGTVTLAVLAIGITLTYQELTHTAHFIDILNLINKGEIKYPLKYINFKKYCKKVNLLTDLVFREFHIFMVSFCVSFHIFVTLLLLLSQEFNFYLLASFIFFNFITSIFLNQCFAYVWMGFTLWFMSTLYLKYKFIEIRDKIELSLKHSNINLLMNAIEEHNYVEIMTKKFNHFFRMITFIIYYIATIGFQLMFFAIHKKDIKILGRIGATTIFGTCFWVVLFMNIMSIWVNKAAHKPYYKLYSIINKHGIPMRFRQHWKLLSFIEKLSGPPIGYYCYNLFPMNNWEFYQYLYIAGTNYILIMGLFD